MSNKGFWTLIIFLVLVGIIFGVVFAKPYTVRGTLFDPPVKAENFELVSSQGGMYRLSEHNEKFVMIFFGYTSCPDVCPTTLFALKQVKERLGELANNIEFVFITVDPARDTQSQMSAYLKSFDQSFFGLTGTEKELSKVWEDYFVYRAIQDTGSAAGYLVDHTARLYLVSPNGDLIVNYLSDVPVDDLVSDLVYFFENDAK